MKWDRNDAGVPGFHLGQKQIGLLRKILRQQCWPLLGSETDLWVKISPHCVWFSGPVTGTAGWWPIEPGQVLDQIFKHTSRSALEILAELCSPYPRPTTGSCPCGDSVLLYQRCSLTGDSQGEREGGRSPGQSGPPNLWDQGVHQI